MLGAAGGPIVRQHPRPEDGSGRADFVDHRVLGEDLDVMPALHQPPYGAQSGRDGAAAVHEGKQVRPRSASGHQRDGSPKSVSRPSM